jgi:hypothetical protein
MLQPSERWRGTFREELDPARGAFGHRGDLPER